MKILKDGELVDRKTFSEKMLHEGISLYEVVRVFRGRVVFLEDHAERLRRSVGKCGWTVEVTTEGIREKLERLIQAEGIAEGNIKLALHDAGRGVEEYVYQIPHDYPREEEYREGVRAMTLEAVRERAEVKYMLPGLRELTDRLIRERGVKEVLLVDREGYITEGSRSNVFFLLEGKLHTAPLPHVLPGTTRGMVLEMCKKMGVEVVERRVAREEVAEARGAFLTGTSPLVLPLRQIDETALEVDDPLQRRVVERYLSLFK